MKKETLFIIPEALIVEFEREDIILASGEWQDTGEVNDSGIV